MTLKAQTLTGTMTSPMGYRRCSFVDEPNDGDDVSTGEHGEAGDVGHEDGAS